MLYTRDFVRFPLVAWQPHCDNKTPGSYCTWQSNSLAMDVYFTFQCLNEFKSELQRCWQVDFFCTFLNYCTEPGQIFCSIQIQTEELSVFFFFHKKGIMCICNMWLSIWKTLQKLYGVFSLPFWLTLYHWAATCLSFNDNVLTA